jgi:hypothetical protein
MVDVARLTGNTSENLRDRQQCSTKGSQGSDQDHAERDGGVEKTTRDSERGERWEKLYVVEQTMERRSRVI